MPAAKRKTKRFGEGVRENEKKWGKKLLSAGWAMLPSLILERQRALGLDAIDVNIILHLVRHWWYAERLPYPSKREIAECMNIHESTVRRRIAKLEAAGFVKRIPRKNKQRGQTTNEYDLRGLIREASKFAEEKLARKEAEKREAEEMRKRKKPDLRVVGNQE